MSYGSGQDAATLTEWVGCTDCEHVGLIDIYYTDGSATWTCPQCKHLNREEGIHP